MGVIFVSALRKLRINLETVSGIILHYNESEYDAVFDYQNILTIW